MDDDTRDHGQAAPDVDVVPTISAEVKHSPVEIGITTTLIAAMGRDKEHQPRKHGGQESHQDQGIYRKLGLALLNILCTSHLFTSRIGPGLCIPPVKKK